MKGTSEMYSYVYCRGKERWGRKGGERVTGIDERTETEISSL